MNKAWEGSGKGRGGRPWRRKRQRVLERDQYLCVPCAKRSLVTLATEVDHIIDLANGGSDDESNLQSICEPCHKAKTAAAQGKQQSVDPPKARKPRLATICTDRTRSVDYARGPRIRMV